MKKTYESPKMEITVFNTTEDILLLSDVIIDTGNLWGDSGLWA